MSRAESGACGFGFVALGLRGKEGGPGSEDRGDGEARFKAVKERAVNEELATAKIGWDHGEVSA